MLSAHDAKKLATDAGYNTMLNTDEFKRIVDVIEKDIKRAASEGRTTTTGPLNMIDYQSVDCLLLKAVVNYMKSFGYEFSFSISPYRTLYDCYYSCDWEKA